MISNSIIDWMLEDNNPSIKYRTLTEILDKSDDDIEVKKTYELIWKQKHVQKIFSKQDENKLWPTFDFGNNTSMRYLTALAEHGLHCDKRIDNSIDFAVNFLNEKENAIGNEGYDGCSNALVLRAIVMLGYHTRSDVLVLLNKYVSSQLNDGGFICKKLLTKKPERKSCYRASVAALLLYSSCKEKEITFHNTNSLVDYFLKRDIFYMHDKKTIIVDSKPGWRYIDNFFPVESMRIGLPLILYSLCLLGAGNDIATEKAWNLIMSKKNNDERLVLEGTLSKQPCSFGKVGQENKWVTFYSLLAQKLLHLDLCQKPKSCIGQ